MKKIFFGIMILLVSTPLSFAQGGWKKPPENIVKVFNAPTAPFIQMVPFSPYGFEMKYRSYAKLETLAEPLLKLAGKQISARLNAPIEQNPYLSLKIHNFDTGVSLPVVLPENAAIRSVQASLDRRKAVAVIEEKDGLYLWVIDMTTGTAKKIPGIRLNEAIYQQVEWLNDSKRLLVLTVPAGRGEPPGTSLVPDGPVMQETTGKISKQRMTTNLLQNAYDEKLFEYYFTSQPAVINTETGAVELIGSPAIYNGFTPSPDNKYIIVSHIERPYSYQFGYWNFPETQELWDATGKLVKILIKRPLTGDVPPGGALSGPRDYSWQPLKDATLVWVEALDNGDPKAKVPFRDKVMTQNAPFTKKPKELLKTVDRFSGLRWSENGSEALFYEYNADKLWYVVNRIILKTGKKEEILSQSTREKYNDPGDIISRRTLRGESVYIQDGDTIYYNNTTGATPDGNKPFIASFNMREKKQTILFRSRAERSETVQAVYDRSFEHIIIRSESLTEPRNYYFMTVKDGTQRALTDFKNPYPELTGLKKEIVKYTRKDGVTLSATLYLPANYNGERLPLVIEAYPEEYTSASTAGQISGSPYRFTTFWGHSIVYFALNGYAVLANASIPIIGDPETVNNTFIAQTVDSVDAAINYLDSRGIVDPKRVGITGHSYGAFMVATVLVHSDICAAGIAKSGAYNRTLTPFGFQSERRTLWKAKDFYINASPFMYADKVTEPIMLIHGQDDSNPGTYPIQSERFYQALQVNGATARLVMLPFEDHGYYAEESNLHALAEMMEWFDRFVKNKK